VHSKNPSRIRQGSVKGVVAAWASPSENADVREVTALTPEVLDRPQLRPYCTNDHLFSGPSPHLEVSRDRVGAQARPAGPLPHREALVIGADEARLLARAALADAGLCATDAKQVADALVDTSLRGIDNYGLRLLPHYLDELAAGLADATATISVVSDRGAGLLIDADGALGVVAGMAAAQLAAKRAAKFGIAAVAVRHCNDFGAASVYTRQLAREGLVGIAVTSASSGYGGVEPLFGTDPTTLVQDDEIADSHQALAAAGALLGRVLTGAPLDRQPAGESRGVSHLLIALDPAAFGGHAELGAGLAEMLCGRRADAPSDSQCTRLSQAIPLDARTADVLFPLAEYLGVPGPWSVLRVERTRDVSPGSQCPYGAHIRGPGGGS
jgi:ureidoglycolate dehydrogenase (NAD+)